MQLGPIEPAPRAANPGEECGLALPAFGSRLPEAGADDADSPHALREAIIHGGEDLRGRNGNDCEIDRLRDVSDRAARRAALRSRRPRDVRG